LLPCTLPCGPDQGTVHLIVQDTQRRRSQQETCGNTAETEDKPIDSIGDGRAPECPYRIGNHSGSVSGFCRRLVVPGRGCCARPLADLACPVDFVGAGRTGDVCASEPVRCVQLREQEFIGCCVSWDFGVLVVGYRAWSSPGG